MNAIAKMTNSQINKAIIELQAQRRSRKRMGMTYEHFTQQIISLERTLRIRHGR